MSERERGVHGLTEEELDELERRVSVPEGWVAVSQVARVVRSLREVRREHERWRAALATAIAATDSAVLARAARDIVGGKRP
jgi:hypothetical protein